MRRVIVESMGGFEAALRHLNGEAVAWRTTSPGLLALLAARGENAASLEDELSLVEQDAVGKASYDFALAATTLLDERCTWRSYASMGSIFGLALAQLTYVFLYKGLLLHRVLEESSDGVLCVGRPRVTPVVGLNIGVGRFDTLYALLAKRMGLDGLDILDYEEDPTRLQALDAWVTNRRMGRWEKLLSLCTNTPSSFAYKLWRALESRGMLRRVRLYRKPRKQLFLHKDCELIQEAFLNLLCRGAELSRLPALPNPKVESVDQQDMPGGTALVGELEAICMEITRNRGLPQGRALAAACAVIASRIGCATARLRAALPETDVCFGRIATTMGPKGMVVSNFFTSPVERLFGLWCREHKVPVVAFEHGITLGLSDWAAYPARFWGMLLANIGVYHWGRSLEDLRPWLGGQRVVLGGVPRVTERAPLRLMQRALARRWLRLPLKAKVIIYVADVERNNAAYGPHIDNDLQYAQITEVIVEELVRRNPRGVVLLKLYPTHRYSESYGFDTLLARHPEVRVIKDMDFRFIRTAADLIALSSSQSTLSWALGAGCPVWMFEKEASPVRLSGRELSIAVPGVRRVLELDFAPEHARGGEAALIMDNC
jgi:hypothetical protein